MKFDPIPACVALLLTLMLTAPAAWAQASPPPALRVCLDADSPPFSDQTNASGIDLDLAQALAKALERPLRAVWVTVPARGGLAKALRESLQQDHCELFLGLPDTPELRADLKHRQLMASQPYLTLGYLILSRAGASSRLDEMPKGARIGAVTATPADLYLYKHAGAARMAFSASGELVSAVRSGEIAAALVWSSALAREQGQTEGLQVSSDGLCDPDLRTGMLAAVRGDAGGQGAAIAATLERLSADGSLEAIAQAHHLPWLAGAMPACAATIPTTRTR